MKQPNQNPHQPKSGRPLSQTVIHTVKPTVAMIELDEERLDRMRQVGSGAAVVSSCGFCRGSIFFLCFCLGFLGLFLNTFPSIWLGFSSGFIVVGLTKRPFRDYFSSLLREANPSLLKRCPRPKKMG